MFKDVEGISKVSYSNRELAKVSIVPESTIRKCNQELERKNFLQIIKNEEIWKLVVKQKRKIFNLNKLG